MVHTSQIHRPTAPCQYYLRSLDLLGEQARQNGAVDESIAGLDGGLAEL
jgi:hypothetical protein